MAKAFRLNRESQLPRYEDHMRFICPECGMENYTQQDWRKHLNITHSYATKSAKDFNFKAINNKFHECQTCMKWVANAHQAIALLQYHHFLHCPFPRTYKCIHCLASFTRKKALCEHMNRFHFNIMSQIDAERKMQELKKSYDDQSPKHNSDFFMKYLCPLCGKIFERYNMWQQHVDAAHSATSVDLRMFRIQSTKNYYCAQCCQTLYDGPTKTELQRHNFTHQPYPLYFQCSYCSLKKCYKTELLVHFIKTHKEEFEKLKEFVKKPSEWGGQVDEQVVKELDALLAKSEATQTDILQKAIRNSLIDVEEDAGKEQKFNHESALDESLQELDDVLNSEMNPHLQLKENEDTTDCEFDDEELEDLCQHMFEEVFEEESSKPNRKRLKLDLSPPENLLKITDSMQKEMQKYINYLCPECGEEFESQSVWRTHVFEEHNLANAVETKFRSFDADKTSFICLVCYEVQRTAKQADLRRHHFQHMPYQAYLKCAICTKTKSSKPKMLQHLQFSHLKEIQKSATSSNGKTVAKNFRCLDCDKMYAQQTRFESHRQQCPQRLKPLAVGLYDIEKNMKLLKHLKTASRRIEQLLAEEGIDASSFKLPYK